MTTPLHRPFPQHELVASNRKSARHFWISDRPRKTVSSGLLITLGKPKQKSAQGRGELNDPQAKFGPANRTKSNPSHRADAARLLAN